MHGNLRPLINDGYLWNNINGDKTNYGWIVLVQLKQKTVAASRSALWALPRPEEGMLFSKHLENTFLASKSLEKGPSICLSSPFCFPNNHLL